MKSVLLLALFASLVFLANHSPASEKEALDHSYKSYTSLLQTYVEMKQENKKSIVRYDQIDLSKLNSEVEKFLSVTKKQVEKEFTKKQRLAYYINLYNILTLQLITKNLKKVRAQGNTIKAVGGLGWFSTSTWDLDFFTLFGKKTTLNEIEHGYIRGAKSGFDLAKKEYDEPRIHFAVNCASKGCPALRNEAFTAEKLDAQLEDSMRAFLQDRDRNYIKGNTAYLSKIFHWYEEDFERGFLGYHSLKDVVRKHIDQLAEKPWPAKFTLDDFAVSATEYDWTLNDEI